MAVDQVMKATEPHNPQMRVYYDEVRKLEEKFKGFELHHSYRHFNAEADELSTIASGRMPVLDGIFTSDLYEPTIKSGRRKQNRTTKQLRRLTPTRRWQRLTSWTGINPSSTG